MLCLSGFELYSRWVPLTIKSPSFVQLPFFEILNMWLVILVNIRYRVQADLKSFICG